jgi:hypothetical protein
MKGTALVVDTDSGGGWKRHGIQRLSVFSTQFCWELKIVLKLAYLKKIAV